MQENSMKISVRICLQAEGKEKNILVNHFPFRIGRDSSSVDLAIPDAQTSRIHAQLILQNGGVWLENLSTTNGTFVNGERICESIQLSDGDEAKIGKFTLHFAIMEEKSASDPLNELPFTQQADRSQEELPFVQQTDSNSERKELCGQCGAPLKPGALFCGKCGTPVEQSESVSPFSAFSQQTDESQAESPFVQQTGSNSEKKDLCGQCGAPLKPGALFCAKCGTSVEQLESVPSFSGVPQQADESQAELPFVQQTGSNPERNELCGQCGAALKPGALFCGKCGAPVEQSASVPPFSGVPQQADESQAESPFVQQTDSDAERKELCGKCGAPLKPGALFCGKCGAPTAPSDRSVAAVSPYTVQKKTSPFIAPKKRKSKWFILLGGAVIALILLVVTLSSIFGGRSWEAVIDQLFDSMSTADTEKYFAVYSTELQAAFEEAQNSNFQMGEQEEIWDAQKDYFDRTIEMFNAECGDGWSYSYEIKDEIDVDGYMLHKLNQTVEELLGESKLSIDNVKEVNVNFTIVSADGEKEKDYSMMVYLTKIKNSWYLLGFFVT